MEKLAEPVLFDDSGRHVDMTEIIENLYIGTQWVLSCPGHVDGCWSKFSSSIPFVRGAAKNTFYLKKVGWRTYNPFAPCSWVDPPEWPPCVTNSIIDHPVCVQLLCPTFMTPMCDQWRHWRLFVRPTCVTNQFDQPVWPISVTHYPITVFVPKVGVTHVLNTAEGQQSGTVDTNEKFYK